MFFVLWPFSDVISFIFQSFLKSLTWRLENNLSKKVQKLKFNVVTKELMIQSVDLVFRLGLHIVLLSLSLSLSLCVCVCVCLFLSSEKASPDWTEQWTYCQIYRPTLLCWGNYSVSRTFVSMSWSIIVGTF